METEPEFDGDGLHCHPQGPPSWESALVHTYDSNLRGILPHRVRCSEKLAWGPRQAEQGEQRVVSSAVGGSWSHNSLSYV